MPHEMRIYFILGLNKGYETDGERMLRCLVSRYSLDSSMYDVVYCYDSQPPSKLVDRQPMRDEARKWIEAMWTEVPGVLVGLGWMPCEVLTGRGKTKLKHMAGTKWKYVGEIDQAVWITYDPAACLYDPGLVVDISAVVVAAMKEIEASVFMNTSNNLYQMNKMWKRYL
jgi:hypothetical protein